MFATTLPLSFPNSMLSIPYLYTPPPLTVTSSYLFRIPLTYALFLFLLFLFLLCPYDPQNPVWKNAISSPAGAGPTVKWLFCNRQKVYVTDV